MAKLKRLGPLVLSLLLLIVGLEAVSFVYLSLSTGAMHGSEFYYARMNPAAALSGCPWGSTVSHHPYLDLRYHQGLPCSNLKANRRGMIGEELPRDMGDQHYNVLLLGGSVAENMFDHNELDLELNRVLRPPGGKPFKVWNASISAGEQPRQAIAHLLYGETADLVISIEGFNEHFSYGTQLMLETPSHTWTEMEEILLGALGNGGLRAYLRGWLKRSTLDAAETPLVKESFTVVLFHMLGSRALRDKARSSLAVAPYVSSPRLEARIDYVAEYASYLASMGQLARGRGQELLVFFQPVPALYKPLTEADRTAAQDLSYAQDYRDLVTGVTNHPAHKVKVIPILDTFKDYQGDLYKDLIHFRDDSRGNEWLAKRIVAEVAKNTNLKKK